MRKQLALISTVILGLLLVPAVGSGLSATREGETRLSSDQAAVAAMNDLQATAGGYRLHNPHHTATFTPDGLEFRPQGGGPAWAWHLAAVSAGDAPLAGVTSGAVRPARGRGVEVTYSRGGVVERYLAREDCLEQQFLIPRPLPLDGADLTITGAVQSAGDFEETADGWHWRTGVRGVRLGRVLVYDAQGALLPATMSATADSTRITVDGTALAQAVYPVTVDPEIGNDFVLSSMGPYTDPNYDALNPAVVYNSANNQYLVVWSGSDDVIGEYEIWGQRVNAATGAQVGSDVQISFVGPADDPLYDAQNPDVAYNSQADDYLVVWTADHQTESEFEIYGRRVSASSGQPYGQMVRISVMGGTGAANYDAYDPAVAYNSADNEYLVVWEGDTTGSGLLDNEYEIWGKLLEGDAEWIGSDFRLSDMGGLGDAAYDGFDPDVAYNSTDNQYMVVWEGDDKAYNRADDEFEIWGQRLNASGGAMGASDFRISTMGPNNDPDYDAFDPAIAYNRRNNQYLVVWEGEDYAADAYDIFGQRMEYNGIQVGDDDFRLSHSGNGPNSDYDALNPAAAYDSYNDEYLVVWQDDELGAGEFEIFGQRVDAGDGVSVGVDTRLSDMGADGDADHDAQTPAVAYSANNNQYLVAWSGDNSTDGEFEIWAQRFTGGAKVFLPVTLRND